LQFRDRGLQKKRLFRYFISNKKGESVKIISVMRISSISKPETFRQIALVDAGSEYWIAFSCGLTGAQHHYWETGQEFNKTEYVRYRIPKKDWSWNYWIKAQEEFAGMDMDLAKEYEKKLLIKALVKEINKRKP